jgi:hypothetical protein
VARLGVAVLAVSAGVATASGPLGAGAEEWQEEVRLRPTSVEALLTHRDAGSSGAPTIPVDGGGLVVDPDKYVTVTVEHDARGGQCPGATDSYVTMTATRRDGGVDTLVAQCEGSAVDVGEAREAASARVRQAARLALPRAGFDPKVRGLVGLRTWLHVAVPHERLVSASVGGYEVRAIARPIAVEVTIDGEKQPVRLEPDPGAPLDAVGPFVFRRSGRHELSVRVMWMAEWVLVDDEGSPVRFGTIPSVPGPTITSQYPVVQAQALLR